MTTPITTTLQEARMEVAEVLEEVLVAEIKLEEEVPLVEEDQAGTPTAEAAIEAIRPITQASKPRELQKN